MNNAMISACFDPMRQGHSCVIVLQAGRLGVIAAGNVWFRLKKGRMLMDQEARFAIVLALRAAERSLTAAADVVSDCAGLVELIRDVAAPVANAVFFRRGERHADNLPESAVFPGRSSLPADELAGNFDIHVRRDARLSPSS